MAGYRIKALGSGFTVGTDAGAVLICRTMKAARRIVADAERLERLPPRRLPPRGSRSGAEPPADFAELDGPDLIWHGA